MTEKETRKEDEEMCLRDCENKCKIETMVGDGERESGGENAGEEQEGNLERNNPENEERSAKNEGDLKDVQPNTQVTLDLTSQGLNKDKLAGQRCTSTKEWAKIRRDDTRIPTGKEG